MSDFDTDNNNAQYEHNKPVIEAPEFLNIPDTCLPLITEFNDWAEFLLEGGRGSGKSQSIARVLLYIGEHRKVRIFCGRETQANIEDSVYTILADLVGEHKLNYIVMGNKIKHRVTGSEFRFRGFRDQNRSGVKGIEGADILWIDEAQEIHKDTLDVIMPTIRKQGSRVIFSMNRFVREDPVYVYCMGSSVCKHIKVNYYDNPHLPDGLRRQALECKERSEREYNHIWLGEPLASADDFLFPSDLLERACMVDAVGVEPAVRQRVMGIDVAAQGDDSCVITILDRVTHRHFATVATEAWDYKEPAESVGRIVELIGRYKPDFAGIDIGGLGYTMASTIREALGSNAGLLRDFDGASTKGIDKRAYRNKRSAGYHHVLQMLNDCTLRLSRERDKQAIFELERTRFKYLTSGQRQIFSKQELKRKDAIGYSPDRADSLMMACWATKWLGNEQGGMYNGGNAQTIRRVNKRKLKGF